RGRLMPAPCVPETSGARALVWMLLALGVLAGSLPRDPAVFGPVWSKGACRLGIPGKGLACACEQLDAPTRFALGLPLGLDRLGPGELERLDGIGPARAAAIALERERAGPFGSAEALARRVAGIGPAIAARIGKQLAGEPGAACRSTAPGDLR